MKEPERYSLAALGLALLLYAGASLAQPRQAFQAPDPVEFGVRLELGDIDRAREWLDAGLDPDYLADRIGSGLMIAAWQGDLALMELFAARGAAIDKANALGESALMHAAWRGHLKAVHWLLERGAAVDRAPLHWSALHYAVFAGHGEIADALLERGADVNALSTNGSSPLMMAVYEGHEPLVRGLLARGADAGLKNDRGDGALDWAFRFNRLGIARLVASAPEFVAAANRPKTQWGEPVRSRPDPRPAVITPAAAALEPKSIAVAEIEELLQIRNVLLARRMTEAVARLDRRIDRLREREQARATEPTGATRAGQIDELERIRGILASRGMTDAVATVDRRLDALRKRRARSKPEGPPAAVLEISARRAAPQEQSSRLLFSPGP